MHGWIGISYQEGFNVSRSKWELTKSTSGNRTIERPAFLEGMVLYE